MLLRNTRVLDVQVRDTLVAAYEPDAALVQVDRVGEIFLFEHVQAPLFLGGRFPRFGRLVVFEDFGGAGYGVGFFGEETRGFVVGFLFGRGWKTAGGVGASALDAGVAAVGFVLRW